MKVHVPNAIMGPLASIANAIKMTQMIIKYLRYLRKKLILEYILYLGKSWPCASNCTDIAIAWFLIGLNTVHTDCMVFSYFDSTVLT